MPALSEPGHRLSERARELLATLGTWPWAETARTLRERFAQDRLGVTAGSLTFTTLIALVPLITVMLAVFSAFPMFSTFQGALEKFFLQSLVPDTIARPVLRSLTQFAAKASRLGSAGLLLLLVTALALMLTIDRTLNSIWRVRRPRPLAQRVLVWWAFLTLGPLALGVSLSLTSYAVSASRGFVAALPGGVNLLFDIVQFLLLAATIAGLYHYVPNTFVRWRHAWAGALFVAVAFELAKTALAWYVERLGTYATVYGAFATLPILLLWIYVCWVIVLLGAVVAAYAPSLQMRVVRRRGPGQRFTLALLLIDELARARATPQRGLTLAALAARAGLETLQVEPVLDELVDFGWVGRLEEDGAQRHVLLADLGELPARRLVDAMLLEPGPLTAAFARRLDLERLTLAELLSGTARASAPAPP